MKKFISFALSELIFAGGSAGALNNRLAVPAAKEEPKKEVKVSKSQRVKNFAKGVMLFPFKFAWGVVKYHLIAGGVLFGDFVAVTAYMRYFLYGAIDACQYAAGHMNEIFAEARFDPLEQANFIDYISRAIDAFYGLASGDDQALTYIVQNLSALSAVKNHHWRDAYTAFEAARGQSGDRKANSNVQVNLNALANLPETIHNMVERGTNGAINLDSVDLLVTHIRTNVICSRETIDANTQFVFVGNITPKQFEDARVALMRLRSELGAENETPVIAFCNALVYIKRALVAQGVLPRSQPGASGGSLSTADPD